MAEYVVCQICGRKYSIITASHLKQHKLTVKEYRENYPDAELMSEDVKCKINEGGFSEETRRKMSEARKGKTYEELYGEEKAEEMRCKSSERMKKDNPMRREEVVDKQRGDNANPRKPEVRKKISETVKNHRKNPNSVFNTEEYRKKLSKGISGVKQPMSQRIKSSIRMKENNPLHDPEVLSRMSNINLPTKPELRLMELLDKLYPNEFKYNMADFILGGKIPDFFNINGKKKLIELFGCYWHACSLCHPNHLDKQTIHNDDNQRLKLFREYGYETLVVWEHELKNSNSLKSKIINFVGGK